MVTVDLLDGYAKLKDLPLVRSTYTYLNSWYTLWCNRMKFSLLVILFIEHNQYHFYDESYCSPYYHVIESANYASAINYCSEDPTCAMFYQKKSSAKDEGDEFYFCNVNAEIKNENTHDHLHVKCRC